MTNYLISLMMIMPILGVLSILLVRRNPFMWGIIFSTLSLIISWVIFYSFDHQLKSYQFQEKILLIESLQIYYHVGINGISLALILLSTLLIPICLLASIKSIKTNANAFVIAFLLLEVMVLGVFCALDLVLFYLFFEAVLMPMYIIIGIWGGELRVYAAYKFFLYTLLGSILFLLAIIYIYVKFAHFDISLLSLQLPELELNTQKLLWLAFFASFAVKIPMWPFHTWLPYAHVQAPTAGSVILAGILIKIGAFGFIKFSLPMLPQASVYFAPMIYTLSAIAIIYASLVALVQEDMKKLIAYSSVAHMGIVTIGIFSFNGEGIVGAMVQMISHGIISAALFLGVGVLYDRTHTKNIASYGGVANVMPKFAFCLMIITMASIGLPGTSGFMGEFMALVGIYATSKISCLIACFGMILGAYYMLLLYKKVMLGKAESDLVLKLKDIDFLEMAIFLSLIGLILLIGIYPKVLTDIFVADIFSLVEDLKLRK